MMPGTVHDVADKQSVGQRSAPVCAGGAGRKELVATSRKEHCFAVRMTGQHGAVSDGRNGDAPGQGWAAQAVGHQISSTTRVKGQAVMSGGASPSAVARSIWCSCSSMRILGSTGRLPLPHPGLARAAFREQIEGLLEGGVDIFLFETFDRLETLLLAFEEARRACDLPVIAQMTFGEDLTANDGTTPEAAAAALTAAAVDAVGVNCGAGPLVCMEALVRTGPPTATVARSIVPNAGLPQRVEGNFVYSAGPEYFGEMVPQMLAAGARIVGGCCGTTPVHTKSMRTAIDALAEKRGARTAVAPQPEEAAAIAAAP